MLSELLRQKKFVITCEIDPPQGSDIRVFRQELQKIRVDAVCVAERAGGPQLSAFGTALIAKSEKREPILGVTYRHRSERAVQADLIAASALEIHNILCMPGEGVDAISLLKLIKSLNRGQTQAGEKLVGRTNLFPGTMLSVHDRNALAVARKERLVGAEFFCTDILFEVAPLASLLDNYEKKFGEPLRDIMLPSIFLLSTADQLATLKSAGVVVPKKIEKRIGAARKQIEEGAAISLELMDAVKALGVGGINFVFDKNFGLLNRAVDALRQ
ncbi:MAG: methylenetetrahydrofolate reductase [Candidatus Micrarchaeia archaeon]